MLKLSTSYSKKVPVAGQEFSSQQFHASVEVELADALEPQQIQKRIHDTFQMVRDAVETELSGKAPVQLKFPPFFGQVVKPRFGQRHSPEKRETGHGPETEKAFG